MTSSYLPIDSPTASDAANSCECHILVDLRLRAIQSLENNPNFHGRLASFAIQIESNDGTLILNGRVPSFYLKQVLQETLRHVAGVTNVENHVVVVKPRSLISID